MTDSTKPQGETTTEAKAPRKQRATAAATAAPPPAPSGVDQVKAELSARAEAMPTPPAPDSDAVLPQGSGLFDNFGVELPTVEAFVKLGGKAADYDGYVMSRCQIKPESDVVAAAVAASIPQTKMAGKAMAEMILAESFRKRTGQSVEAPLREEDLREDWHEVQATARQPAPAELAGLYIVTHGTLWFHKDKIVPKGYKVILSADEAKAFLERELVRPLKTAA